MNIKKIYDAVNGDEMNSPLPSIVSELEQQGYKVKIEGVEVTAVDMPDNLLDDLEKATNEFEIELLKDNQGEQKFKLVFTGYHKFGFQQIN
ncbi:MAG: hypothetical protein B6D44_00300 [Ignavibacteriales bacterium UTCHB2]|jgi:hypothetical protein|nr:hypothetical protein [Ignavibacteriales bacterium]OQY76027.1 MAG: hypothetical protein B6D44_00300 [Ignavibacteriales bacterium UTCHB2]